MFLDQLTLSSDTKTGVTNAIIAFGIVAADGSICSSGSRGMLRRLVARKISPCLIFQDAAASRRAVSLRTHRCRGCTSFALWVPRRTFTSSPMHQVLPLGGGGRIRSKHVSPVQVSDHLGTVKTSHRRGSRSKRLRRHSSKTLFFDDFGRSSTLCKRCRRLRRPSLTLLDAFEDLRRSSDVRKRKICRQPAPYLRPTICSQSTLSPRGRGFLQKHVKVTEGYALFRCKLEETRPRNYTLDARHRQMCARVLT